MLTLIVIFHITSLHEQLRYQLKKNIEASTSVFGHIVAIKRILNI
jgi:hypothetical protein